MNLTEERIIGLVGLAAISLIAMIWWCRAGEQPMTQSERNEMYRTQAAYAEQRRVDMIIGEATLPDEEFIKKMVRDNHQWAGEKLKACREELGMVKAHLRELREKP